jgi:hypothetical protein
MNLNSHSARVPQDAIDQVHALLTQAFTILKPFVVTLTSEQRLAMPKMGDKSQPFVSDANNFSGQNPEFLPAFITKQDFDIDLGDAVGLKGIQLLSNQIATAIDDTVMAAGSEAYMAALAYYNNVKLAAKQNIPGAKDIFNDLQKRFPGFSRKNEEKQA